MARVVLWLPVTAAKFFAVIAIFSPLIMGITVFNVAMALAAGLAYVTLPRLWRWLT